MKRFILLFAAALLGLSQAAAAVKPCPELQAEIEAKLAAHGVKSYELIVADKGVAAAGKVVGACSGGSKRIIYLKKRADQSALVKTGPAAAEPPAPTEAPEKPAAEAVFAQAAPFEPAAAAVLPNEAPVVEVRMIAAPSTSSAIKSCAELKAEIAAKLAAKGVQAYELIVSDHNTPAAGKVVGICENSSKTIIYSKK